MDKTYVVSIPGKNDEEVSAARAEFIAGQNRVTFYDDNNEVVGSMTGSGISFRVKSS